MASILVAIIGAVSFSALFGNLLFARKVTGGAICQSVIVAITLAYKKRIVGASLATIGLVFSTFSVALIEWGSRMLGDTPPLYKSL